MRAPPFTPDEFLAVFGSYNDAIGPYAPLVLWLIAALALLAGVRDGRRGGRVLLLSLALLWAWSGVAYHWLFFRQLQPAGALYAVAFAAQAVLLVRSGVRRTLSIQPRRDWQSAFGASVIAYAMVLYPVTSGALGHRVPAAPTFGAPCPVVMLTLGVLTMARPRVPVVHLLIPTGWAIVGASAAMTLGMQEDLGLPIAALGALAALVFPGHPRARAAAAGGGAVR